VPLEIQPKLAARLQEREFERLGSTRTRRVDVRLVAATNRDLERMIAEREFRSDLYYRLNVFPIRIPPLRERREDIALLARYFVQKCARQMQKQIETIPAAAMKAMTECDWPGNVRELTELHRASGDPDAGQGAGSAGGGVGKSGASINSVGSLNAERAGGDRADREGDDQRDG
jgi:transcriptional regulator with GAF, ATPase, and Fis domain